MIIKIIRFRQNMFLLELMWTACWDFEISGFIELYIYGDPEKQCQCPLTIEELNQHSITAGIKCGKKFILNFIQKLFREAFQS